MIGKLSGKTPRGYLELAQVMGGTLARNGLRGLFKLAIAGFLAPAALGVLRSVFAFFKIVTSLADLGLGYALVTFVSPTLRRGATEERDRLLKTVLVLKLLVAGLVILVGNLLAPWLTRWLFSDPELTLWVRLAFFAVGGQLLWKFVQSYFSAHQQFDRLALFLTTVPMLMWAVFLALLLADHFSLSAAILIYLFAPAAAALIWWPTLDRRFLRRHADRGLALRIARFSRWVYLSATTSSMRSHLNPILLKNARLSGSVELGNVSAGLYGFGNDLANEITVLSQSMITVLLPKAAEKASPAELRGFVRRSYLHLLFILPPLGLLVFLAEPFLRLLGRIHAPYLEYLPSLDVFAILYIGTLFSVAAIPIQATLYALHEPHVETWIELATIPILIVGSILLIPTHGVVGAAAMVFVQRLVSFIALLTYGLIRIGRLPAEPS